MLLDHVESQSQEITFRQECRSIQQSTRVQVRLGDDDDAEIVCAFVCVHVCVCIHANVVGIIGDLAVSRNVRVLALYHVIAIKVNVMKFQSPSCVYVYKDDNYHIRNFKFYNVLSEVF